MEATKAKKEKPPPGPDDLVRGSAGVYRTGDGRFEVQKTDQGWYLVDGEQTNEFGQQLIHGPLGTLDAIREAIPGAREIKPLLRVRPPETKAPTASGRTAKPAPPAPPPASWIDRLPVKEAERVRRLIRALQKEGLEEAEDLVRRHREDTTGALAARLIEQRLRALVNEQPDEERERAQQLVRRATEILADDGATVARPAPRWALVEISDDEQLPRDRIRPQP